MLIPTPFYHNYNQLCSDANCILSVPKKKKKKREPTFKQSACACVSPEDAAEPREDEEEAEEGMAEPVVETDTVAAATAGGPIEALLRPMARLLTGPRPEGAETVAEPTEEV